MLNCNFSVNGARDKRTARTFLGPALCVLYLQSILDLCTWTLNAGAHGHIIGTVRIGYQAQIAEVLRARSSPICWKIPQQLPLTISQDWSPKLT